MKFHFILYLSLFLCSVGTAQNNNLRLYGTASQGGTNTSLGTGKSFGTIFSLNQDGTDFIKLHDFDSTNGQAPQGALTLLSDGRLAGITVHGGKYGHGVLFTINRDGSDYKVLKHFVDTRPSKGILLASDSSLYGTTGSTPTTGGVIYRIKPDGTGYTELSHFDPLNFGTIDTWDSPTPLIELQEGDLVGATSYGTNGFGFVFRMAKNATSFSTLYTCTNEVGGNPVGIILASDGLLYLTTQSQGGSILSLKTDGSEVKEIFKWTDTSGAIGRYPHWGITESQDGYLYGTTMWRSDLFDNSGVVFKINKDGSGYTPLYITDGQDGAAASYGVTIGSNNRVFTGFMTGGQFGVGTIVSMNNDGSDFQVLKNFDYESGAIPGIGNLILALPPEVPNNEMKYFTLSGLITKPGALKLTNGHAKLFYCLGGLAAQADITNGSLEMDSIREGKYFLQVVPQGAEGSDVFPTYYIAAKLHHQADTLFISSDTTLNMELLPKQHPVNGNENHRITGKVVSDDSSGANTGGRIMSTEAIADVPVYLLEELGDVVKDIAVTDLEGYFKFNGTSDGIYRLALDIVGSNQSTSSAFTLDKKVETMDFTARVTQKSTPGVEYSVNITTEVYERSSEILIYPNPVSDKFILELSRADLNDFNYLNIYSGNGRLIKQFNKLPTTNHMELDVSELPAGLYLLQVALRTRSQQVKFIKLK